MKKKLAVAGVVCFLAAVAMVALLAQPQQQQQQPANPPPEQAPPPQVSEPAAVIPPSAAEIQAVVDDAMRRQAAREHERLLEGLEELRGRVAETPQRECSVSVPWERHFDLIEHLVGAAGDAPEAARKREIAGIAIEDVDGLQRHAANLEADSCRAYDDYLREKKAEDDALGVARQNLDLAGEEVRGDRWPFKNFFEFEFSLGFEIFSLLDQAKFRRFDGQMALMAKRAFFQHKRQVHNSWFDTGVLNPSERRRLYSRTRRGSIENGVVRIELPSSHRPNHNDRVLEKHVQQAVVTACVARVSDRAELTDIVLGHRPDGRARDLYRDVAETLVSTISVNARSGAEDKICSKDGAAFMSKLVTDAVDQIDQYRVHWRTLEILYRSVRQDAQTELALMGRALSRGYYLPGIAPWVAEDSPPAN